MSLNSIIQHSARGDESDTTLRMYSIANKQRMNLLAGGAGSSGVNKTMDSPGQPRVTMPGSDKQSSD